MIMTADTMLADAAAVIERQSDDEAGRVAWGVGEPLNETWPAAKIDGWWDAHRRWGKQEDVG